MQNLEQVFSSIVDELIRNSIHSEVVTPDNVFQGANLKNRSIVHKVGSFLVKPNSLLVNSSVLVELGKLAREGKSCLILMEHYSNFDLPSFFMLMERSGPEALEVSNQVIAIAGRKLNEEQTFVRVFSEAYSRIVIYPSRSIEPLLSNPEEAAAEIARARSLNRAALHAMVRKKHEGNIILVFPAGTRYRVGDPSTKRGLREMDSYVKSFDHLLFIGTSGNCMEALPNTRMSQEFPRQDTLVYYCDSQITDSKAFRASCEDKPLPPDGDAKQRTADEIMAKLDVLHLKAEAMRNGLVQ